MTNASPRPIVIVAPMNWGLGHATRSVPVVEALLASGAQVHLASDGDALSLLRKEFPQLPWHTLPSYGITYPKGSFAWHMTRQGFRMIGAYFNERRVIKRIARQTGARAVVSDHRLGCRVGGLYNVVIAHLVRLPRVGPLSWFMRLNQYRFLNQFDALWIPDLPEPPGLSGALGHTRWQHRRRRFVGALTRMKPLPKVDQRANLIAVLSGPEPARTHFEQRIVAQMAAMTTKKFILVRGLPRAKDVLPVPAHIEVHNFMASHDLQLAIASADSMLSRSGYSTILDLTVLKKPTCFVPTPGQPEQEQLAAGLAAQKLFPTASQDNFEIATFLKELPQYKGFSDWPDSKHLLAEAVGDLMAILTCNAKPE